MDTCILAIAGSDSCGGAGIQADIKTAQGLGVHAACAVTCVTAQNTCSFDAAALVDPAVIAAQIKSVAADLPIGAVKVGMLGSPEAAIAVAAALQELRAANPNLPVVVATVTAATTDRAGAREVVGRAICRHLVPMATLVTPNLPEAQLMGGFCQQILSGATTADNNVVPVPEHASSDVLAAWAARSMIAAGAKAVLVKGGHGNGETVRDLLFGTAEDLALSVTSPLVEERCVGDDPQEAESADCEPHVPVARVMVGPGSRDAHLSRPIAYDALRLPGEFHGTGCVLSTAIACGLARGLELPRAIGDAHALLHAALEHPLPLGHGSHLIQP